jgi:hypothetical protein
MRPFGYIPSIEFLRPSEELAYVIGVKVGDGYAGKSRHAVKSYNRVRIGLEVKEIESLLRSLVDAWRSTGKETNKPEVQEVP